VQVVNGDGVRKTIRIGKANQAEAEEFGRHVNRLNNSLILNRPVDRPTVVWISELSECMRGKLVRAGLVAAPESITYATTLAAFLDAYAAARTDVKPQTREHFVRVRNHLVRYFGAEKPLIDITPGDADDWRRWLARREDPEKRGAGLADNTVRRECGRAKQFFRAAERKRLIPTNPFADMRDTNVRANKDREHFVTRAVAEKVLAACPDVEWKLLFALSRYGGLRCPSEHLGLLWTDVDWERGRMVIRSPKTERHEGKATRVIPIFPELQPYLEAQWDRAPEGASFVIRRYRKRNANLRTQLERIIERAGLEAWPKLFQNLRSTRETELAEE
jgi:integrase